MAMYYKAFGKSFFMCYRRRSWLLQHSYLAASTVYTTLFLESEQSFLFMRLSFCSEWSEKLLCSIRYCGYVSTRFTFFTKDLRVPAKNRFGAVHNLKSKRSICHSSEKSILVLGGLRKCTKPCVDMYSPSENRVMSSMYIWKN